MVLATFLKIVMYGCLVAVHREEMRAITRSATVDVGKKSHAAKKKESRPRRPMQAPVQMWLKDLEYVLKELTILHRHHVIESVCCALRDARIDNRTFVRRLGREIGIQRVREAIQIARNIRTDGARNAHRPR